MASHDKFKVIIAGGGVAGLTLANMLEKFDIDYMVLESHKEMAPQVGASIGLFPNGMRILDQIGCYKPIEALAVEHPRKAYTRDKNGKVLANLQDSAKHLARRHGYPVIFFDRQWLLRVLYDKLQHPERVLPNKRAVKIDHKGRGVEVTTKDGDKFFGTLVIGTDGIHSTVRSEMFRNGNELQPGYFDSDEEDRVPCYYKCSFGIAQNVPGWDPEELDNVVGDGNSQLVISGPENRVYWFLFSRLPEPKYGKDIPSYTKDDEAQFVKENYNLPITEKVTFGRVFSKRLSSTLTPLHEVVYKKWFFRRIMIFGDSAHKPNPIGGQGGNGAIESAAEFINALLAKRDSRPTGLAGLTDRDVEDIFAQTQSAREARAHHVVEIAHSQQALSAYESRLFSAYVWNVAGPFVGDESALERMGPSFINGTRIKQLPLPIRPHIVPYTDELPAKPIGKATVNCVRLGFAGVMGLLLAPAATSYMKIFEPTTMALAFRNSSSARINLVRALSQLIPPSLLFTIEGYRVGNQGTLLALPSLFTVGTQFIGIDRVAPLYELISAFQGFEIPTGRYVTPAVAKALLPALMLSYVIPAAFVFLPTPQIQSMEGQTATWHVAPFIFSALTSVLSTGLAWWRDRSLSEKEKEAGEPHFALYTADDVPSLESSYAWVFLLQAAVHISATTYSLASPGAFAAGTLGLSRVSNTLTNLAKPTLTITNTALLANNLYSIWGFRSRGYIKTCEAIRAAFAVMAGQLIVGPGATWTGFWYWRERVFVSISQRWKTGDK
ncbi:FAD binding domain protein [Jackrogersella minutella]|nr:FAD binding domain protein [Jackrogersella minutella]